MLATDPGCRRDVEMRELVMPLRATRTIRTGDGCDITDGGIYPPTGPNSGTCAPGPIIGNPGRQPLRIDLFAGAGRFSGRFQAGGLARDRRQQVTCLRRAHQQRNLGSPRTLIAFCTPEDDMPRGDQQHRDGVDRARSVIAERDDQDVCKCQPGKKAPEHESSPGGSSVMHAT